VRFNFLFCFFLVLKICSFLSRVHFFKTRCNFFFIPTEIIPICKSFEHLKTFLTIEIKIHILIFFQRKILKPQRFK
jgi:hypothetical protein